MGDGEESKWKYVGALQNNEVCKENFAGKRGDVGPSFEVGRPDTSGRRQEEVSGMKMAAAQRNTDRWQGVTPAPDPVRPASGLERRGRWGISSLRWRLAVVSASRGGS